MKFAPPTHITPIHVSDPVSLTDPDTQPGSVVFDRSLWFSGEGPPPSANTLGAKDGDCYLDTLTGDVYRFGV